MGATMKPWVRALAIAAGYGLALGAAGVLVELRYRWADPADVQASSGMYAFGDLISVLVLGGAFSLVPTWFLLRALAGSERFWDVLSWACLPWTGLSALSGLTWLLQVGGGGGRGSEVPPLLALAGALGLLRVVVGPPTLAFAALAWRICAWPHMKRRFLWAIGLEACGVLALGIWAARAVLSRQA